MDQTDDDSQVFLNYSGFLFKKSPNILIGFQKRWFKIENNGTMLGYYEGPNDKRKGEIAIIRLQEITKEKDLLLNLNIEGRTYVLRAETQDSRDVWYDMIQKCQQWQQKNILGMAFSGNKQGRAQTSGDLNRSTFRRRQMTSNIQEENDQFEEMAKEEEQEDEKKEDSEPEQNKDDLESFKQSQLQHQNEIQFQQKKDISNEIFSLLRSKKIYIDAMADILAPRIIIGKFYKQGRLSESKFQERHFLLVSDHSLYEGSNDDEILKQEQLPQNLLLNTIYYYKKQEDQQPQGDINLSQVLESKISDNHENKDGYFIKLNCGERIFVFQYETQELRDDWIFSIRAATQNARGESQIVILGHVDRIIDYYDIYEDDKREEVIDDLIQKLIDKILLDSQINKIKILQYIIEQVAEELCNDMGTFQEKHRNDVSQMFFEIYHEKILQILKGINIINQDYWENNYMNFQDIDFFEYAHVFVSYIKQIEKYADDQRLNNSFLFLIQQIIQNNLNHENFIDILQIIEDIEQKELLSAKYLEDKYMAIFFTKYTRIMIEKFIIVVRTKIHEYDIKLCTYICQNYNILIDFINKTEQKLQNQYGMLPDLIKDLLIKQDLIDRISQLNLQSIEKIIQMIIMNFKTYFFNSFQDLEIENICNDILNFVEKQLNNVKSEFIHQIINRIYIYFSQYYFCCLLFHYVNRESFEQSSLKSKNDRKIIKKLFGKYLDKDVIKEQLQLIKTLQKSIYCPFFFEVIKFIKQIKQKIGFSFQSIILYQISENFKKQIQNELSKTEGDMNDYQLQFIKIFTELFGKSINLYDDKFRNELIYFRDLVVQLTMKNLMLKDMKILQNQFFIQYEKIQKQRQSMFQRKQENVQNHGFLYLKEKNINYNIKKEWEQKFFRKLQNRFIAYQGNFQNMKDEDAIEGLFQIQIDNNLEIYHDDIKEQIFIIYIKDKIYKFKAEDKQSRNSWVNKLKSTKLRQSVFGGNQIYRIQSMALKIKINQGCQPIFQDYNKPQQSKHIQELIQYYDQAFHQEQQRIIDKSYSLIDI